MEDISVSVPKEEDDFFVKCKILKRKCDEYEEVRMLLLEGRSKKGLFWWHNYYSNTKKWLSFVSVTIGVRVSPRIGLVWVSPNVGDVIWVILCIDPKPPAPNNSFSLPDIPLYLLQRKLGLASHARLIAGLHKWSIYCNSSATKTRYFMYDGQVNLYGSIWTKLPTDTYIRVALGL